MTDSTILSYSTKAALPPFNDNDDRPAMLYWRDIEGLPAGKYLIVYMLKSELQMLVDDVYRVHKIVARGHDGE